ncbi:MAG: adenosylcobalamin-dependent ribonucleoside-diphosphate reductase [Candidatus Micrarchaeia archaeon]|jgi:ribonucleoside-diphosphate reductase alpha chain
MAVFKIRKRDGSVQTFFPGKIAVAVGKALAETAEGNAADAKRIASRVSSSIASSFSGKIPSVENVQDAVEAELVRGGFAKAAKAYILYREKRGEIRAAKRALGVASDELKLSVNAVQVMQKRYLRRGANGEIAETPGRAFRRVAKNIAAVEKKWRYSPREIRDAEQEFYGAMARLEFLPNSPTLMNAGTRLQQLSACFVLPVEDSLEGIFSSVKNMAVIQQSGGGTGFSFSRLRPKGDIVGSTHGVASGPLSFLRIFDAATDVIKQGGRRRGANMAIMAASHPDIVEFITVKADGKSFLNFNFSVGASDKFMRAVEKGKPWELVNPRSGRAVRTLPARELFGLICEYAWKTGDPGLVFIDEINRRNPTPMLGKMESTNPCGEQPLLPYEACNLGSINLHKMLRENAKGKLEVDWEKLRKTVSTAVRFLDDVVQASAFPLPETTRLVHGNRKVGLGVMGFADLLLELGIPYDSNEALVFGEKLMRFVHERAVAASVGLAAKRGSFGNFKGSAWQKKGLKGMRNATVTTIAPTGTISIIAGASSGIEPLFAVSFVRNVLEGARLIEANPVFERVAKQRGFYSQELMAKIAKVGSVQNIAEVPPDVRRVFKAAQDVAPSWHVKMQAAFQKYSDNAVSKTINLPENATVEDVRNAYLLAYKLKCKGITVYRYGSKENQVLSFGGAEEGRAEKMVTADAEYAGGCPTPICPA